MKKTLFRTGLILSLLAFFLSVLSLYSLGRYGLVQAQSCSDIVCSTGSSTYLACNQSQQDCWQQKINEAQSQSITLTNTINLLNGQISLQQLQVSQTLAEISQLEKEIVDLSDRIKGLGYSLDRLSAVLIERVRTQYKQSRSATPVLSLIAVDNLSEFITRSKYLLLAQKQTVDAMTKTEAQRLEYDDQKQLKQEKQLELEVKKDLLLRQKQGLDSKRGAQKKLLEQTQNSEKIYQQELAVVLAEYQAIQAIIAGQGKESQVRTVKKQEKIASVKVGPSCNSGGTHLHFTVVKDNSVVNPFSLLKTIGYTNCSSSYCGAPLADAFNPSGSWDWPLKETIKFNQGYGVTWAVNNPWISGVFYDSHNGLDISSYNSLDIFSVAEGTLFRGSYIGNNGCFLPYVKVEHQGENVNTYYLHVNY